MTQNEKVFLQWIMEERIDYHGKSISPEFLEREREAIDRSETLLDELKQNLSEEDKHKLWKYIDEISNMHAYDSDYFYQKGFEDGITLAKVVYGFEPSEILSVISNRMKES